MAFTDDDARVAWNRGARAWDAFVEEGADYYRLEVHGPALLEACGDVAGRRVLDLGCGQGYFTRSLAAAGAHVVGIDLSDAMIEVARGRRREGDRIEYHVMSGAGVAERWPAGSFDLVASCMAVQDMADPGAVLRAARQVLTPGGRVVFSVPHPFTELPVRGWITDASGRKLALQVDRYFESGPRMFEWNMARLAYGWATPYTRRTLSEWSALIAEAGLAIRAMHEPRPTADQIAREPRLEDCARVPYFLIFDNTIREGASYL